MLIIKRKYFHKNCPDLLKDLDIQFAPNSLPLKFRNKLWLIEDDVLFINTWYGASNKFYLNKHGMSLSCLYDLFNDVCKDALNLKLSSLGSPQSFIPEIDFNKFNISYIKLFIKNNKAKKVFVSNGEIKSGQSKKFKISPVIFSLAKKHKDILFFLTNQEKGCEFKTHGNVIYTPDIINKKNGSDLNENAFLSTFCDLIIGRASGSYAFAYNKVNYFRKAKFLCFYRHKTHPRIPNISWIGHELSSKVKFKAKFIGSSAINHNMIYKTILHHLK